MDASKKGSPRTPAKEEKIIKQRRLTARYGFPYFTSCFGQAILLTVHTNLAPIMETTRYLVFQPGTNLHVTFDSYQAAWEFAESYFQEGGGIAVVEQITQNN